MSTQGEAAEQVVNMATRLTVKGVEVTANLVGKGAISLATFLLAAIKDQKRTKGKVRIKSFQGKPTKVFEIRNTDMETFAKEAKKYGVKYAAILDTKDKNGICDVVVNAEDGAKVSRIAEKFSLATVKVKKEDIPKTKQSTQKANEEIKNPTKAAKETINPFGSSSKNNENKPSVRKEIRDIQKQQVTRNTKHIQPQKRKYTSKKMR